MSPSEGDPPSAGDPHKPIFTLLNLLGHKAHRSYPPGSTISSTFGLNREVRKQIKLINEYNLVGVTKSEDLKQVWT